MTEQVAILGLGRIGASIGLALSTHAGRYYRVGYDRKQEAGRHALKAGCIDELAAGPRDAVGNADVIVLALPLDEIQETMEAIAPALKDDVLVMDTAPGKKTVAAWAGEHLPGSVSYAGLVPVLNPDYLRGDVNGDHFAKGDLFENSMIGLVTPPGTQSEAIQTAAEFIEMLGSAPLFADLYEADGLMSAVHIAPQLVSAAFWDATVNQPGWRESRKLAGSAYADLTAAIAHPDAPGTLAQLALSNKTDILRALDQVIASLQGIRDEIEAEDLAALRGKLADTSDGKKRWWKERQAADWLHGDSPRTERASGRGVFRTLFGLGRRSNED